MSYSQNGIVCVSHSVLGNKRSRGISLETVGCINSRQRKQQDGYRLYQVPSQKWAGRASRCRLSHSMKSKNISRLLSIDQGSSRARGTESPVRDLSHVSTILLNNHCMYSKGRTAHPYLSLAVRGLKDESTRVGKRGARVSVLQYAWTSYNQAH